MSEPIDDQSEEQKKPISAVNEEKTVTSASANVISTSYGGLQPELARHGPKLDGTGPRSFDGRCPHADYLQSLEKQYKKCDTRKFDPTDL